MRLRCGPALVFLAGLALAGCTSLKPAVPARSVLTPAEQVSFLQKVEAFQINGRVAGAVGKEGFNAQLDLQQRGDRSTLALRSPLGFGSATVETDGRSLQYRSSRGEQLAGEAGLNALAARLGFEPPLSSLRYWLLGVPDPALPAVEQVTVPDAPRTFEQRGWQITISEPAAAAAGSATVQVPRRVTIERPPARLRIIVDKWKLG